MKEATILTRHSAFSRKRFLNFLSSFDLIDLPMRKLFDVLTKNLRVAEGLVYVYQFNAVSWEQEVEFICGDQDLLQWQVGTMARGDADTSTLYYDAGTAPQHTGNHNEDHSSKPTAT